jgi:integration host factor subunit alpha
MTKADIVANIYDNLGVLSKKESAEVTETVFETMKQALGQGDMLKISGFGNFVVRTKRQRVGRNPKTGDKITITARRVLTFKPSQVLKHALNG